MTEKQTLYRINTRQSIKLCKEMELLVEYADYQEKMLNYESREVAVCRYNEIKIELDSIWDMQVNLFFDIQEEYKEYQKGALLQSFKVLANHNKHIANKKDY